jgi:FG-GAP-like repeat/FG-GAP repeat
VGDVNGDGFGDVVVHPKQPSSGSVTLFYGNASGLSRTPVTVYASVVNAGVAGGGDVNHDGFADVALGYGPNVNASGAEHGYVNVVRGSASGLLTATAQQLRDIAPLRFGRTVGATPRGWPMASQGEGLGWMWGWAGESRGWGSLGTDYGAALVGVDIEGDGFEDFAASAPSLNSVWVTSFGATLRRVELNGPAGSSFGASLAVFDVNNDGFRDVVVGAPGASSVYVYWGRVTGISLSAPSVLTGVAGSQFGAAVANVGDVNRDGIEDLAVGSPASRQAFVYTGRAMGGPALAATLSGSLGFGRALSFADVNGDRFSDVLVGAPDSDQVSVFHGGASGPSATANAVLRGAGGSQFGSSVIGIGDSNVDGFHDVVVGAPAGSELRLFRGSAAGLNTTMVNSLAGAAGSQLGTSLALLSARDPMWGSHSLVIAGSPGSNQVAVFGVGSGGIQGMCPRGAPDCNGLPTLRYISPRGYSSFGSPLY